MVVEEPESLEREWFGSGNVQIVSWGPNFSVRLLPLEPQGELVRPLNQTVKGEGGFGVDRFGVQGLDPRGPRHETLERSLWPPYRVARWQDSSPQAGFRGILVFFYDVTIRMPTGEDLTLGPAETELISGGMGLNARQHRYYLTMQAETWAADGPWFWLIRSLHGDFDGELAFQDADGRVEVDGRPQPWNKTLLVADGDFALSMNAAAGHQVWVLDGDASRVGIDGQVIWQDRDSWPIAVAVAGTGAGFSVLWWLISKRVLSRPLSNENRRHVLQVIDANPGIHFRAIQRATGLGNGALVYALRVLSSAGLVHSTRVMGRKVYGIASGDGPGVPDALLASIDSRRVEIIIEAALARPGIKRLDLVALSQREGLSRPAAYRIIRRLEMAGSLVEDKGIRVNRIPLGLTIQP